MKNMDGYKKLTDGSWDFDVFMDMIFSFWVLKPIPKSFPKHEELLECGICYTCTCPAFNHYFVCKHSLALGLINKKTKVPTRFSTQTLGKRKAPAGATLRKRTHALEIDA